MKTLKSMLVAAFALCVFVAPAMAGLKTVQFTTASLANGAIDTMYVNLGDVAFFDVAGVAQIYAAISNMELAAADSCNLGIDLGVAGSNPSSGSTAGAWTQVFAMGNDGTALNAQESKEINFTALTGGTLRVRVKNVSGGAEAISWALTYPVP